MVNRIPATRLYLVIALIAFSLLLAALSAAAGTTAPASPPTPTPVGDYPDKPDVSDPGPPDHLRPGTVTPCVNGMADVYPCFGIDLYARVPFTMFSFNPTRASSIWGYVDLDDMREYALIGLNTGTGVVDITDPANPVVVGTVRGRPQVGARSKCSSSSTLLPTAGTPTPMWSLTRRASASRSWT